MESITTVSIFVPESVDIKRLADFLDVFAGGFKVIPLWNVYYGDDKEPVSIVRVSTPEPQVVVLFVREFLRGIQGTVFCMIGDQGFLLASAGISSLGTSAEKSLGAAG
jgi:hypothetical protein